MGSSGASRHRRQCPGADTPSPTLVGHDRPARGVQPGLTADQFEVRVSTLSSDDEIKGLAKALREGGQTGLRNAMFQLHPKGWSSSASWWERK